MNKQAEELSMSLKDGVLSQVEYPATKAQIIRACSTPGTPEFVLRAAEANLKDKTYNSADEVLEDLEIQ